MLRFIIHVYNDSWSPPIDDMHGTIVIRNIFAFFSFILFSSLDLFCIEYILIDLMARHFIKYSLNANLLS